MYNDAVFIPSSCTLLDCEWHPLIPLVSQDWPIPPWLTDRTWLSLVARAIPLLPRGPSSMAVPLFLCSLLSFSYSSLLQFRIPPYSPGRVSPALCRGGLVRERLCIFLGRPRFRVGTTNCEEYRRNFLHTGKQRNSIEECCYDRYAFELNKITTVETCRFGEYEGLARHIDLLSNNCTISSRF